MKPLKVTPLHDRVFILPDQEGETVRASGIIVLEEKEKDPSTSGTVVAVGPGKTNEPMSVAVGDKVRYGMNSGMECLIETEIYLIMREKDITMIMS